MSSSLLQDVDEMPFPPEPMPVPPPAVSAPTKTQSHWKAYAAAGVAALAGGYLSRSKGWAFMIGILLASALVVYLAARYGLGW